MNIASIMTDSAQSFPDGPALTLGGETLTFRELDENSRQIAAALSRLDIGEGRRVALMLSNHPSFVSTYFAIQRTGAVAVLINPALKASEVAFVLNDSRSVALVTTGALRHHLAMSDLPHLEHVILTEGHGDNGDLLLEDLMSEETPDFQAAELAHDTLSTLLYTSGTTGFPKGAMLSHGNLMSTARQCSEAFGMGPNERVLIFLPVCHSFGLTTILIPSLKAGAAVILHAESDIGSVVSAVSEHEITMFLAVPTIYNVLRDAASAHDMRSVGRYVSAGATLPLEIARGWREKFGLAITEGLGCSEGSLLCLNPSPDDKPGSVGLPLSETEMRIVDKDGSEAEAGESGEVTVRGPSVMLGYWNRPEATAEAVRDGWFHTGDIGRKDADGYFYITDRVKDMVGVGGEKVYPSEVENVLLRHPAVAEAAVYGVPEPVLGEQVRADVVLGSEQSAGTEDISNFIAEFLADYKLPAVIRVVPSLPKGKTGKILKRILREEAIGSAGSPPVIPARAETRSPKEIRAWLGQWLRGRLSTRDPIAPDRPFNDYGLTSVLAVKMVTELNEWLGAAHEATIVWNHPTIDTLTSHLAGQFPETGGHATRMTLWPAIDPYHVYDALMYDRMMNDHERTRKFRLAIERAVSGKVVLQIGPGETAVLSRMCADAGAARIYAVEIGERAFHKARKRVADLGLSDRITVIHGDVMDVSLPEPADICVSGLAGQIGGSEGVAVIINQARHLLSPSPIIIPERCVSRIAAVTLPDALLHHPRFTSLGQEYARKIFEQVGHPFDLRLVISDFDKSSIVSDTAVFEDLDFSGPAPPAFEHDIRLTMDREARVDGLVIWLNLHTLGDIVIDILEKGDSWLPIYFPIFCPGITVSPGDVIEADCVGSLSGNQINPDYRIRGRLIRQNGMRHEFDHFSPHHERHFRQSRFYKRLFEENGGILPEAECPGPDGSPHVFGRSEPIAIVGVGCRFPGGSDTPDKFWELLRSGSDAVGDIPRDRWDAERYYDPDPETPGKAYVRKGCFLSDIDRFDPVFFGISPKEAASTDPQQRLILETCWEALERSGLVPDRLVNSRTGVFAGLFWDDYSAQRLYVDDEERIDSHRTLSAMRGFAAGRPAYLMGLQGPAMQVDTSCSSSLLTVHLACQSLRNRECDLALAGGVHLTLSPRMGIALCQLGVLSADGHCKTFDAKADGFGMGEGCGMVVLKRLADAVRDGDNVMAVIRGSAVNHDGPSNGLTAPNGQAQEAVIRKALENAGVEPDQIQYVETHGTGTVLGDPVEVSALANAVCRKRAEPLFIGSVKANVGHLSSAAGIASLAKVILSLGNREIPPNPHFTDPNPHIPWDRFTLTVPTVPTPWETDGAPRLAGVSSFGMTGTNVHMIVGEAPERKSEAAERQDPRIFVLSAMNGDRLRAYADKIVAFLDGGNISLADLAYTFQTGRKAMKCRLAAVVGTPGELGEKLARHVRGEEGIEDFYLGSVGNAATDENDLSGILTRGEAGKTFLRMMTDQGDLRGIAQLWVSGADIDWHSLYPSGRPRCIPAPTYPFARERCWIAVPASGDDRSAGMCHPLLHENTSLLSEQRFTSTFTGGEFFLSDRLVKGQPTLPGMALLEMARAAVAHSLEGNGTGEIGMRLRNVLWADPVPVGESLPLHISLFAEEGGEIVYEIYSRPGGEDAEPVVHSQGTAVPNPPNDVPDLDIGTLRRECAPRQAVSGRHGTEMYVGKGLALARLRLPDSVSDTMEQFVLHPLLVDLAARAWASLANGTGTLDPVSPAALGGLDIFHRCPSVAWVILRIGERADIDLCDENGRVCARMTGIDCFQEAGPHVSDSGKGNARPGLVLPDRSPDKSERKPVFRLDAPARKVSLFENGSAVQGSVLSRGDGDDSGKGIALTGEETRACQPGRVSLSAPAAFEPGEKRASGPGPISLSVPAAFEPEEKRASGPGPISLSVPAAFEPEGKKASGTVSLPIPEAFGEEPLEKPEESAPPVATSAMTPAVSLSRHDQGIYRIECRGDRSEDICRDIVKSFQIIGDDRDAFAVLLNAPDFNFLSSESAALASRICHALLNCGIPVISMMGPESGTSGMLVGLCSDFMIFAEDVQYRYHGEELEGMLGKAQQTALLSRRWGAEFARTCMTKGLDCGGRELREKGTVARVVPESELAAAAEELLASLIRGEMQAIRLLKQHLCREVRSIFSGESLSSHGEESSEQVERAATDILSYKKLSIAERPPDICGPFTEVDMGSDVMHARQYLDGVLLVRMCDRKSRNTFSEDFTEGFTKVFEYAGENEACKIVILTGYDSYFACGGTKEGLVSIYEGKSRFTDNDTYSLPAECPVPVIAAMQGHGIGAGWSMGMFCDFVIFSEESIYVSNYMRYGFTPGAGATLIFPERLGDDLGREILFTADEYRGSDLRNRGMPNPVLSRERVLPYAMGVAGELAKSSREQLIQAKQWHVRRLRDRIGTVCEQELLMHDKTFVGNERVLERIRQEYNQGMPGSDDSAGLSQPSPLHTNDADDGVQGSALSMVPSPDHLSEVRE